MKFSPGAPSLLCSALVLLVACGNASSSPSGADTQAATGPSVPASDLPTADAMPGTAEAPIGTTSATAGPPVTSATQPSNSGPVEPPIASSQASTTTTPTSSDATAASGTTALPANTAVGSASAEPTASVASTSSTEPEASQTDTTAPTDIPTPPSTELTAAQLLAQFDLGWNLGNSLDVPEGETAWGNPDVSPELLQAVADAGFDVVRIPVTWSTFTGSAPEYTIDAARLARVEAVVGYALDAGLHAIINLHHDGADDYDGVEWLSLNDTSGAVTEANNAEVEARFVSVWSQIATHFAAFDSRLLFESMNEIHVGYDAPQAAYYTIINHLNQVFVGTVRGSGGSNATRFLVIPGYNTNIDYTLEGFEAPTDPAASKLILSVHFYDPWSFAGEGSSHAWGTGAEGADSWGQEDFVVTQFDRLKAAYVDQGLPMILGEYGAVNQTGAEAYRRYYMEYVTQAACQRGIVPVYWDNGGVGTGPDNFGLLDRSSLDLPFPEILDAMFRGCASDEALTAIATP
jgi:endoglucanase